MLTRIHFEAIANTLSTMEDSKGKRTMIKSYVEMFSASNPRFDENRFRKACESP